METYFDGKKHQASVQALNELFENAQHLCNFWNRINVVPLTSDLYLAWLADFELLYDTYRESKLKVMDSAVWDGLSESAKRPELDEKNTRGRLRRVWSVAAQYSRPFDGTQVVANVGHISWKDGKPFISDATKNELKKLCTFKIATGQQAFVDALQDYCNALEKVQVESKSLLNTSLSISQLPVSYDGEKATIDMARLFDMLTLKEYVKGQIGRVVFPASSKQERKEVVMPESFKTITV